MKVPAITVVVIKPQGTSAAYFRRKKNETNPKEDTTKNRITILG